MLSMDLDGPGVGKPLVFAVTRKAEVVIVICLSQLGSTGTPMGIMAVKAEDPGIEMATLLKIEPLLMMGF